MCMFFFLFMTLLLICFLKVSLSQMLNDIVWPDHIQLQPPTDPTLYRTRPLTEIWVVSIEHLRRGVACRQGTLTTPDTWSRPFGTCICSTCWDQSFSELVVILPDYALRISLGTFSILPCMECKESQILWISCIYEWLQYLNQLGLPECWTWPLKVILDKE